jgi:type II secretory pathway predicted ATPase ExeA
MWSDNDTSEDLIGFRVHAELIRDVVGDDTVLPVTIGVFADWGSGKTSIMKMLQAELAKNDEIAVVYFDAWLFEGYDDAKSALVSSNLKQLMGNKRFPAEIETYLSLLFAKRDLPVEDFKVCLAEYEKFRAAMPAIHLAAFE